MKIIDHFPSMPKSTFADPKLSPPPLTYDTLKKAIALLDQESIIRFEVNLKLFTEIRARTKSTTKPLFKLINPFAISYIPYDSIPIILIPDQVEPLKIIKKRRKHENQTFRKKDSSKTR